MRTQKLQFSERVSTSLVVPIQCLAGVVGESSRLNCEQYSHKGMLALRCL